LILGVGDILREGEADRPPLGAIWVRMPRFIGDAVLIHQALEPLRAAGWQLVAWGPAPIAEMFRGSGAFAGVWADGPERGRPLALRTLLRDHQAAGVVNLPRSSRALVAAWLARVPLRAGWREGGGRFLATAALPFAAPPSGALPPGTSFHQFDRYRRLLDLAFPGLPPAAPVPFRPRPEAMARAVALEASLGLAPPYVVLALGAMTANKRLGTGVWLDLIGRLARRGVQHVLLGGRGEDEAQAAAILAGSPGVPSLAGRIPLSTSAALIARAAAVVGNDSALSHLAAACGTPVVVAFGPTRPGATAPVGPRVRVLRREDLDCLECGGFSCRVPGHPCMEALPGALIEEALVSFMP